MLLLVLEGCAIVDVQDETLYALKGPGQGALEAHFLSTESHDLTQAQWDAISLGMICMGINSFGDFKENVEKLCSANPTECTWETQQQIQSFFLRVDRIRHVIRHRP